MFTTWIKAARSANDWGRKGSTAEEMIEAASSQDLASWTLLALLKTINDVGRVMAGYPADHGDKISLGEPGEDALRDTSVAVGDMLYEACMEGGIYRFLVVHTTAEGACACVIIPEKPTQRDLSLHWACKSCRTTKREAWAVAVGDAGWNADFVRRFSEVSEAVRGGGDLDIFDDGTA